LKGNEEQGEALRDEKGGPARPVKRSKFLFFEEPYLLNLSHETVTAKVPDPLRSLCNKKGDNP
jgi:hypothetical protein